MKALIIGGGICGLTAAAALSKIGLDVLLFEKSSELREVGAGLTLWSNGVSALSNIDLAESAVQHGQIVQCFEFMTERGRRLGSIDLNRFNSFVGYPSVSIHRMKLMQVLRQKLDSAILRLEHELESIAQTESNVTVKFKNGAEEKGDIAIACDGFSSLIRKTIVGAESPVYSGYTCWRGVTNCSPGLLPEGAVFHYSGKGVQLGLLDVGDHTACWYATANLCSGIKDNAAERKAETAKRFSTFPEPVKAILHATPESAYLKNDIFDRNPIKKWHEGRILLMGDAAHPTTPNLGQGACQAIEDAITLAGLLKAKHEFRRVFEEFEFKRQERTRRIVLASRHIGQIGQAENPLLCAVRDLSTELMLKLGSLPDFEYAVKHRVLT